LLLMNAYMSPAAVGIYTIALTIAEKMWLLSDAIGTVVYARVSALREMATQMSDTLLIFKVTVVATSVVAAIVYLLSSKLIILLFSADFQDAVPVLRILVVGTVAGAGYRVLAGALKGMGRPFSQSVIYAAGFSINIVVALILIHQGCKLEGFASAFISSQVAMCVLSMLYLSWLRKCMFRDFYLLSSYEIGRCLHVVRRLTL